MPKTSVLLHITPARFHQLFSRQAEQRLREMAHIVGPFDRDDGTIPAEHIAAAEVAFVSHQSVLDEQCLQGAKQLRWIHEGTGHPPQVAYKNAYERDILITHTGNVFAIPVAEMALAHFLASYRRLVDHDRALHTESGREGEPIENNREAYGKTAGIIGLGNIGRRLAELLHALGMRIVSYDPYPCTDTDEITVAGHVPVHMVPLEQLLPESDGIFVTASPAPSNYHMLNGPLLDLIRSDAILVSVSRASIIDHDALVERLQAGRFRAALDVFPEEPLPVADPLRQLDNVILSPHRAGGTNEARRRMGWDFIHDLERFRAGQKPERNFNVDANIAVERGYMKAE